MRRKHLSGIESLVELILSHQTLFKHDFVNAAVRLKGLLGL